MNKPFKYQQQFVGEIVDVEAREIPPADKAPTYTGLAVGQVRVIPHPPGKVIAPKVYYSKVTPIVNLPEVSLKIAEQDLRKKEDELDSAGNAMIEAVGNFFAAAARYGRADARVRQLKRSIKGRPEVK